MSIFTRALASVGAGAATVHTQLEFSQYRVGDTVNGTVQIHGGTVVQQIDDIYLFLLTQDLHGDEKKEILRVLITEPITIHPDEVKEVAFSFLLPEHTPVTEHGTIVWIHTGLDIKHAVDPTDESRMNILKA